MIEILMTIKDRQSYLDRQLIYLAPFLSDSVRLTVYDDGSLEKLQIPHGTPYVRILHGKENVGLIQARNVLLSNSYQDVEYVLFLDDDIFIYNFSQFLATAVDSLREDSRLLGVSCPYINLPTYKYESISTFTKLYDTNPSDQAYVVYFFGGTSVFSKKMLRDIGGLEGVYKIYLEEEDLALRAYCRGLFFKVLYGYQFIAIHDQAPNKSFEERAIFLLSNRMLFHYKFIGSFFIRMILNSIYLALYLIKTKKIGQLKLAVKRFKAESSKINREQIHLTTLVRFFQKRFL